MAKTRENKKFLPGFKIPSQVRLTSDINEAVLFGDLIVLSVPSEYLIGYFKKNSVTLPIKGKYLSVWSKASIRGLLSACRRLFKNIFPVCRLVVLSGPTIAGEVAAGIPTTAVAACRNKNLAWPFKKFLIQILFVFIPIQM